MKKLIALIGLFMCIAIALPTVASALFYTTSTRYYTDNNGCQVTEIKKTHYGTFAGIPYVISQSLHVITDCGGLITSYDIDMDVLKDAENVAYGFDNINPTDPAGYGYAANEDYQQYWLSNANGTGINDETWGGTRECSEWSECTD
ncbi:MAG: hypothetical protein H6550_16210 [Chitinophagales bacterium]|nr:hypothetical protein [Chitinophagales bacterium]